MYQRRIFTDDEKAKSESIRKALEAAESLIMDTAPSRERSLALTHLEEAMLYANLAITSGGLADK